MRLGDEFYSRDVLDVAPSLLGMVMCRRDEAGTVTRGRISEVEAYRGEDDSACHARFGRTKRAEVLYLAGGHAYVYLCYGMHHLVNVVTGPAGMPQAALIRGVVGVTGPGRVTKALGIRMDDNRADLRTSERLWLEEDGFVATGIETSPRIGIGYATPEDQARLWRFTFTASRDPGLG